MNELERLKALMDSGAVKLGVHIRKANSPGSPVYQAWENLWPAGSIVLASFAATALVHYYLGFAILLVGGWWWIAKLHPKVKDGVFDRTAGFVLAREQNMDALWARGWLTLYAKLADGSEMVATRRESWREFVGRVEVARAQLAEG
ncbi:MAG: hypothetical protein JWO26_184 [Rhodospirillales bacterium]|nr:hypothetical protein [Rhodospirillales bacterium]MDB5380552.1 hypothetical protein [Rhodospirillales bacterium]